MFLARLFDSFRPLQNPIGFGASDFIELALAVMLVVLAALWQPWIEPYARKLAERTVWSMLALAALLLALRLLLLPHHPVPTPEVYDEFSHLLVADTLRHFRLANPAHPLHQFFETFFVLQEPSYSSIYPMGQGAAMALGWVIFGLPWAGVILSVAAFCALCYWMLRGWVSPAWALVGGMLAVIEFGPLNRWMNSYWGGGVTACAGCLVFGALPRLRQSARTRDAVLLGAGLAIHWLTRPFETIFLVLSVIVFFLPSLLKRDEIRALAQPAIAVILMVIPAIAITFAHNKLVTGSWATLPEMASQYQYGVPVSLTFQSIPTPHRELTPEQALGYKMQVSFHPAKETIGTYLTRLEYRVRFYRFFFLAALYVALPVFFWALGRYRFAWIAVTLAIFALGSNFFPFFEFHYIAAVTCLFILVAVVALETLSRVHIGGWRAGREAALLLVFVCIVHFVFWYGLHLFDDQEISRAVMQYETWDQIQHGDPEGRIAVRHALAQLPGKQLVFVRYWPGHIFQNEWVYNSAEIDGARVVWARDLGPAEDEKLRRYYPDRTVWLLEPDARPPKLSPYPQTPDLSPGAAR